MTNSVELVLFYGPPFIGKTLHYFSHYSKTHTRISASEIFKEDKCSNLRLVILKVIGLLNEGKNVVIDDENWYIATRQSYISLVKKKVPICTFTIVQFLTDITSGYQQCLWAREWALVEQTLLENKDYNSTLLTESVEKLDCWFARKRSHLNPPELPATAEGFSIVTVQPKLICGTSYKFNLPALFIQWQSILTDAQNENLNYKSTAPDVLNKWLEKNPSGRILIIGPKTKNDKDVIEEQTKTLLLLLSSQLTCPLYFTFIDEKHQLDHYSQLPQPGVLAFLQKLHTVHLHHKGTIYMYSSDEHYRAASSVGIRTIKTAKLFDHSHLIDSVYCGETTSTLSFLQNMLQVTCSTSCKETRESVDEIPFFSRARKSSTPLVWKYCHGKLTGVCFKDKLALERYQTQYKLAARPAKPPGKIKRGTSRTEYVSSTLPSSERSLPSSEQSLDARALVGNINLREIAETPGRYHGGFQCRDSVFDMNVEVLEQRLKITCKCTGSSRQPYDVQVMLSDSGLLQAHCSCPDVAGKTGRCKHVIGLLLNYKNHQTPSASHVDPSGESNPRSGENNRASRNNKRGVQTLYCMSQEEFMETAKEILKKNEERQEQSLAEEPRNNNGNMLANQQKDRSTVDQVGDVLKEVLFSAINKSGKSPKKLCPERIHSFAEDTPVDRLHCYHQRSDSVTSVIIPDSLVTETVSLIPETIRATSSSYEKPEPRDRRLASDSFEAFLDEVM